MRATTLLLNTVVTIIISHDLTFKISKTVLVISVLQSLNHDEEFSENSGFTT